MDRLTGARASGIKTGYWSPAKTDELIQRLGRYEDTGLMPDEIEPVVHAHWEKVKIHHLDNMGFADWVRGYRCSHCNSQSRYYRKEFKRCPACAAIMDEGAQEDG